MREELDKKLCEDHPYIFRERNMSMQETCMCWGFPGDGWYNIINQLAYSIEHHVKWARENRARVLMENRRLKRALAANDVTLMYNPKYKDNQWHQNQCMEKFTQGEYEKVPNLVHRVVATQVKEKFGTMRFYYRGGDDVVDGMVRMAEAMTSVTCEHCGVPGTHRQVGGWVCTLCESCAENEIKRRQEMYGSDDD